MDPSQTILFMGDSITDCGRREDRFKPYGCGFVSYVRSRFLVEQPELRVTFVNRGIGGDTMENLYARWVDDCLSWKPEILVVGVGINDLNRFVTEPHNVRQAPEGFEQAYNAALTSTREALPECRILLLQPFYATQDTSTGEFRNRVAFILPQYHEAVRRVAQRHRAQVVETQEAFLRLFAHQSVSSYFPDEPVHPGEAGHYLIADEVYRALNSQAKR
jgi:lysophospholipase L1-like esterase